MDDLVRRLTEGLVAKGLTIALAESCTGGYLSHLLLIPGSSKYYDSSTVTYSRRSKTALLGIPADLLQRHGGVSAEAVEAMALNMREMSGAGIALGISGAAGPGDRPNIGRVFMALASEGGVERVQEHRFPGSRQEYKDAVARAAFQMALDYLERRA